MNIHEKNFLKILKAALLDIQPNIEQPIEYSKILSISMSQNIFPLIFEKISEIKDFKESDEYRKYFTDVVLLVLGQTSRTEELVSVYNSFVKESLYPIILKGIVCRKLYGKYEDHRPSSDEDLLVKTEDFYESCRILEKQGYKALKEVEESELEDLQALSFINRKNGMHIELHLNPMGHDNSLRRELDSYFHDIFDDYTEIEVNGTKIRTLNHTNHFLFLILHAFKHFTSNGFGIRQVIDILLYQKNYAKDIDWKYIKSVLKKVRAFNFYNDLVYIGNEYLGFDLETIGLKCCPEDLIDDLFSSGIFGNDTEAKKAAGLFTSEAIEKRDNSGGSSKIHTFKRLMFPSKKHLSGYLPEVINKPVLLPIAWIKRTVSLLNRNMKSGGSLAKESMNIGNRRVALLRKYKVIK